MGRHKGYSPEVEACISPIRRRADARGRLAVLALGAVSYGGAAAGGALLAVLAYLLMGVTGNLDNGTVTYTYVESEDVVRPLPQPTILFDGKGYDAPTKVPPG